MVLPYEELVSLQHTAVTVHCRCNTYRPIPQPAWSGWYVCHHIFKLGLERAACALCAGLASTDPFAAPAININYFSDPADLDTMREGVRLARRIVSEGPLAKYINEVSQGHRDYAQAFRHHHGCMHAEQAWLACFSAAILAYQHVCD